MLHLFIQTIKALETQLELHLGEHIPPPRSNSPNMKPHFTKVFSDIWIERNMEYSYLDLHQVRMRPPLTRPHPSATLILLINAQSDFHRMSVVLLLVYVMVKDSGSNFRRFYLFCFCWKCPQHGTGSHAFKACFLRFEKNGFFHVSVSCFPWAA